MARISFRRSRQPPYTGPEQLSHHVILIAVFETKNVAEFVGDDAEEIDTIDRQ